MVAELNHSCYLMLCMFKDTHTHTHTHTYMKGISQKARRSILEFKSANTYWIGKGESEHGY